SAFEQQAIRFRIVRREMRAIHAVDRGEDRILAARLPPAFLDRGHRERHGIGGLMTAHARASVLADRLEERMAARVDGAGGVQNPEHAVLVRIRDVGREGDAVAWLPPARRRRSRCRCRLRFLRLAILRGHVSRYAARGRARYIGGMRQWTKREQRERTPVLTKAA